MQKKVFTLAMWVVSLALIITACQPAATTEPPAPTQAEAAPATEAPAPAAPTDAPAAPESDKVEVRWFVGLGTGTDPAQIEVQEEVVADFNASHPNINLTLEVVPYDSARDTLSTEIASGAGPDLVGPVGWAGSNAFFGQYLDLTPLIESTGYDTSVFNPALVEFYQTEEGQVGLPFAIFPGATFYQKDLFDEAGLNYPPTSYGEPYVWPDGTEAEWSWDTVAEVAKLLTVDVNGNNATDEGFDRSNIVQVGYNPQWQHPNAVGSFFGAASLNNDGTAQIPEPWKAAWKWWYDGIWGEQPFIANGALAGSAEFGTGNVFNSGKAAMAVTQTWYTCCLADSGSNWDVAALPSYNGEVHGRVDADTFRVLKTTQNPEEAFEVLTYLIGPAVSKLAPTYGAMPALPDEVEKFFAAKAEQYPWVTNWDIFIDGMAYPDTPSAEGYLPNFTEAFARVQTFGDLLQNDGTLDLDAEMDKLTSDLQVIFEK